MKNKKESSIWSAITIAASLFIVLFGLYRESINKEQSITIIIMGAIIIAYLHSGTKFIKFGASVFVVVYSIAMYNAFAIATTDYIIQPTMLTIASIFAFISGTYRHHLSSERSRPLWVALLSVFLIILKSAILVGSHNLIIAEVSGAIFTVIAIMLWNIWILKSDKTRVIKPTYNEEYYSEFIVLSTNEILDTNNHLWIDSKNINGLSARPFLIDSIKHVEEQDKMLAIVNKGNDEHYKEVELNSRNGVLKFLYIQTKDGHYKDIIDDYNNEGRGI